jgi:hypothetical protein
MLRESGPGHQNERAALPFSRHPGYLLKTHGFPSSPRGGFGFIWIPHQFVDLTREQPIALPLSPKKNPFIHQFI